MYATNYFETLILNTLRENSATPPASLYLGAFLSNPGESGTAGAEVTYAGYARQPIAFSTPAPMNEGIGVQNIADATFPATPVNLGEVTHIAVLDSPTAGNMLLYGALTTSYEWKTGESLVVVTGEAQWWFHGDMAKAFKTKCLNWLRGTSLAGFTPYFAMLNGNPESGGVELSGGGYARVPLVFGAPQEQVGGQMEIKNSAAVATARATTDWGTFSYMAIFDSPTAGAPVFYQAQTPRTVRKGLMVQIAGGDVRVAVN